MARMTRPARPGLIARLAAWHSRRQQGSTPEVVHLLGHHPKLLAAAGVYGTLLLSADKLPASLKRLAHLRAAMRIGCPT